MNQLLLQVYQNSPLDSVSEDHLLLRCDSLINLLKRDHKNTSELLNTGTEV